MVGMIQILTYLLCVYLIFKAIEIHMIAFVSTSDKREGAVRFTWVLIIVAMMIAVGFIVWVDNHASSVSNTLNNLR